LLHTFGNTWTIGFLTWYFARKNKPIIRELCNDMSNPLYPIQVENYIKPIFKKNNTLMVAISKRLENLAIKFGVKNVWNRPNPVNEIFCFIDYKQKLLLRTNLTKFNQTDKVLSVIANFSENKNQLFVLDILNLLPKEFKLILAGPLAEHNKYYLKLILDKIDHLKLHDRVDLKVGFIENFDEYLKCSDIFLFPSKSEGLGTPILESLACGVPVISNHIRDVTDTIIIKDEGGYYLDLDEIKWANIIPKVLRIPREVLVNNAKYIISKSSSQVIDEEYFKKIKNLILSES
jgi:glycosyltransferase involved in cell wall biosynthesis